MIDTTSAPPASSTITSVFTVPGTIFLILPLRLLRALIIMILSLSIKRRLDARYGSTELMGTDFSMFSGRLSHLEAWLLEFSRWTNNDGWNGPPRLDLLDCIS